MKQHEQFKNRLPIHEARSAIVEFLEQQRIMNVAVLGKDGFAVIDSIDYFYFMDQHIAIVPPMSKLANYLEDKSVFSGFIQEGFGKGAKKFYGQIECNRLTGDENFINELAKTNHMISKMKSHRAKFFQLNFLEATISLSHSEVYNIKNDLQPTFARFAPNGRERFENSRQVLMTYLDRNVIFSVLVEGDTYYCLAKSDSFKMEHIKAGNTCMIYDGKDNHFETVIEIVDDKKEEIFQKLVATNNAYFKENTGLVALTFKKSK